jgi:isopenicillin N synthase-like dioxygenase
MEACVVPRIDFTAWLSTDEDDEAVRARRAECAGEILAALMDVGFFRLYVPPEHADAAPVLECATEFFAGSDKLDPRLRMNALGRGYTSLGSEVTLQKRDWHEGFDIGPEVPQDPLRFMHGPNEWPDRGPLKQVCTQYYNRWLKSRFQSPTIDRHVASMTRVGRLLMEAIALSLGVTQLLDDGNCHGPNFSLLRLLHYPHVVRDVPVQVRRLVFGRLLSAKHCCDALVLLAGK